MSTVLDRAREALGNVDSSAAWCRAHPDDALRITLQITRLFPRLCPRELAAVLDVRFAVAACMDSKRAVAALGAT